MTILSCCFPVAKLLLLHSIKRRFSSIQLNILTSPLWAKRSILIDKYKATILYAHDHISFSITIDIFKAQRHRGEILSLAYQYRANIDFCFGAISTGTFDNFNAPPQVQGNKMARVGL
jgi:hypothetical protein